MSTLTTIDFHGDSLFAVHAEGSPFVAAKPISDTFGLSWAGQLERIKRDTVLNEGIRVIRIPSPGGADAWLEVGRRMARAVPTSST